MKVAAISDVHGNAVALAAVLAELEREQPDLVVSCGDFTWGPLPEETVALAARMNARFVRGNADRAVLEHQSSTEREQWMQAHHTAEMREFLTGFEDYVVVDVDGLGPVRFCHGSPRSDEECVTPETPAARVREFSDGVDERVIVTAHVHIQFDREVAGIRSVNAGSVGLPYEGVPGAYWALLGPGVELRRTEYDVGEAVDRYRATDFPGVEELVEMMLTPPEPREVIDHAEKVIFAGVAASASPRSAAPQPGSTASGSPSSTRTTISSCLLCGRRSRAVRMSIGPSVRTAAASSISRPTSRGSGAGRTSCPSSGSPARASIWEEARPRSSPCECCPPSTR